MTDLNEAIASLEGEFESKDEAFRRLLTLDEGGKPIFYFGWFWRDVDFEQDIFLAVDKSGRTGFCENNKWGYRTFRLEPDQKTHLVALLQEAVTTRTIDACRAVNAYMRSLGEPQKDRDYYDA